LNARNISFRSFSKSMCGKSGFTSAISLCDIPVRQK
jgi:hypothetical protein